MDNGSDNSHTQLQEICFGREAIDRTTQLEYGIISSILYRMSLFAMDEQCAIASVILPHQHSHSIA